MSATSPQISTSPCFFVSQCSALLFSGFQGGASLATADREHVRVGNDVKAGLAPGRELLFKLGDDVASLLFVLIAFEFRDEKGELLSVRWPRLALRFGLESTKPRAAERSDQKRRPASSLPNGAGDNILENGDPSQIHSAAPSVIGATMGRSIFLGKKRGLCLRRARLWKDAG